MFGEGREVAVFYIDKHSDNKSLSNTHVMQIRPFQPSDLEPLLDLMRLMVPTHFAEEEVLDYENYLREETEAYFVVEREGELIAAGGVNFRADGITARISWDMVHPEFQGKGIGRDLLHHRLDLVKDMSHIQKVDVRTSQHAHRFYEKSGFRLQEVRPDFWAKGFDLYHMEMRVG